MTIADPKKFMDGVWDWGFLEEVLPGKSRVSDIDGIYEKNGNFIVIETKQKGVPLPKGQEYMFKNLVKIGFTILILYGKKNEPVEMEIWYPDRSVKRYEANEERVKNFFSWWLKTYVN